MTVMSSATRELTVGQIVTRAFQLAGVLGDMQQPSDTDGAMARDFLETIIDGLATEGMLARQIRLTNLQLIVGTSAYALSSDTLDVVGDGMYIPAGQSDPANSETRVRLVRLEEWNQLSAKSSTGLPSLMYAYRTASIVELRIWPIPNEAGRIRIEEQRLLADVSDANATPDLQRYWAQYLMWELGHSIAAAKSLPIERVAYFKNEAEKLLLKCKGKAVQRGSVQAFVDHPVGMRRWR
jgi:hypothetical protein